MNSITLVLSIVGFVGSLGYFTLTMRPPASKKLSVKTPAVSVVTKRCIQAALAGVAVGGVISSLTGFWCVVLVMPPISYAVVALFNNKSLEAEKTRNEAYASWVESLKAAFNAGAVDIESAVKASLVSCPEVIKPMVEGLAWRLHNTQPVPEALMQLAKEADTSLMDWICMSLIQASSRGTEGLARSLTEIATSVNRQLRIDADILSKRLEAAQQSRAAVPMSLALILVALYGVSTQGLKPTGVQMIVTVLGFMFAWVIGDLNKQLSPEKQLRHLEYK